MLACYHGHIDIARMLAGEFNANIDMQTTVRAIARSCLCVAMLLVLCCRNVVLVISMFVDFNVQR